METPSLDAMLPMAQPRRSEEVKPMVEQGLRDLAKDFATHGPAYATRYLEFFMGERPTPPLSGRLHTALAEAIRDSVTDSCLAAGARGARLR